jgi:hypothetical protein
VVLFRYPGRRQARWPGAVILVPAAALLAAQMAASGAPARAAVAVATGATWSVQHTPNARVANGTFAAGSCAGPAWCVAVGSTKDSSGTSPLAEAWNGIAWAIQPTPDPTGFGKNSLASVSCGTASACMAVGVSAGREIRSVLAESWDGATWTLQPLPAPSGQFSELSGVSCPSATDCVAVGAYTPVSAVMPLAELWNGTKWTTQYPPSPRAASTPR